MEDVPIGEWSGQVGGAEQAEMFADSGIHLDVAGVSGVEDHFREDGVAQAGGGSVAGGIPVFEASFPIPKSPAEAKVVAGGAHIAIKIRAGGVVCNFVGAEFADVNGTAVKVRPCFGELESAEEGGGAGRVLVGGKRVVAGKPFDDPWFVAGGRDGRERCGRRAGIDKAGGERCGAGPGGALMREEEGFVGVDSDDEVGVFGREAQGGELADAVEIAGTDEDGAVGVGQADATDGFGEDGIEEFGGGGVLWFIQKLESDEMGLAGVTGGDLFPDFIELVGFGGGIGGEGVEVMNVHESAETLSESAVHECIDLLGEGFVDGEVGAGPCVIVPAGGNADVIETFGTDVGEVGGVVGLAPILAGGSFEVVAEIDATH